MAISILLETLLWIRLWVRGIAVSTYVRPSLSFLMMCHRPDPQVSASQSTHLEP